MKKIKNSISLLIFIELLTSAGCYAQSRLSHFNFGSASVLPFYTTHNTKYAILSRERWGRDTGTYDDFGGKRDKGEHHPLVTAAREFWEEACLEKAVGLTLEETQDYINIARSKNTHYIIANTTKKGAKNVTYITHFNKYKTAFLNKFYAAERQETDHHKKEKDRIALVSWPDLTDAINNQQEYNDPVYVQALVINPRTNKKESKQILLRPYLVIKLYGFFKDVPYTKGRSPKIRFYPKSDVSTAKNIASKKHKKTAVYFSDKEYSAKELYDYLHSVYKDYGDNFNVFLFNPNSSGIYAHASDYVNALSQEQCVLEKEMKSTYFFNFFKRKNLTKRYNNNKKMVEILQEYQDTPYW